MYYDPSGWISGDDELVGEIEDKLRCLKKAQPRRSASSKSFLPLFALELDVILEGLVGSLILREWLERDGKININLTINTDSVRKGHFNHKWHHNPNGKEIPPPHHIHFPTVKYRNLDRRHTYAYQVRVNDNDYLSVLKIFCEHVNIRITGVALPLLRRVT